MSSLFDVVSVNTIIIRITDNTLPIVLVAAIHFHLVPFCKFNLCKLSNFCRQKQRQSEVIRIILISFKPEKIKGIGID